MSCIRGTHSGPLRQSLEPALEANDNPFATVVAILKGLETADELDTLRRLYH